MSRLIVKNLANSVTEDKLRKEFSAKGIVTDVQLKYTRQGKFRHFGFVGFKSPEEAKSALEFFNNTFLNATKIQVEFCAALGDSSKPKAWSKYAPDSTAFQKEHGATTATTEKDIIKNVPKKEAKKQQTDHVKEILKKHKDDPMFVEFLESQGKAGTVLGKLCKQESSDDSEDSEKAEENSSEEGQEDEEEEDKAANKKISDLEYLQLKMDGTNKEKTLDTPEKVKGESVRDTFFTVKVRGLSCKAKKKDIKQFFHPLKPKSVRICRQVKGLAYVGFVTEKEMKQALNKHKSFLAGKRLLVLAHSTPQDKEKEVLQGNKWKDQEEGLRNEESIAESGRIFVRNLSYTTTEDILEKLFSKYGPVTETTIPVDRMSRKMKGFGVVTFMVPENAAKAYSELDGTVLQGRMLHLLPGKTKQTLDDLAESDDLTYKQRQLLKQKAQSGSSHNWNSLFLGQNAVADAMARAYNTSKEKVLDPESRDSVAVRLALGETQLVAQTRDFLEGNGISLDAFNQAPKQRSKCIILCKNLPVGTSAEELREMFVKHGELGRVVLPPTGVTAIIEFLEPSEARNAFTRLAYTKFKHLPLYLEWAPEDTFASPASNPSTIKNKKTSKIGDSNDANDNTKLENEEGEEEDEEEEEVEAEQDTTLFVKNLNFTTTEDDLKQHFGKCGKLVKATIVMKKDSRDSSRTLSMGYGFVQFQRKLSSEQALKTLQHSTLQDHAIELKRSNRTLQTEVTTTRKKSQIKSQTGTKIIVKNIPFEATANEIQELFKTFGELKAVRLPRKMVGTGPHRGFAFVDYVTKGDAKRAFKALCQSTHLYGRRLVLDWAAPEETVEDLRKRTAMHFHEDFSLKSKKALMEPDIDEEEENI